MHRIQQLCKIIQQKPLISIGLKIRNRKYGPKPTRSFFLSTYFLSRLTGKIADSRSDTAGHLPFDTKKKQWCGKYDVKSQILQVEPEKYYELTDSCEIIGQLTTAAAELTGLPVGLPIVASGTDKGCETVGVGALTPEIASISLGTQSTVEVTTKKIRGAVSLLPILCGGGE